MKNDNSTKQSNASKPMLANRLFKYRFWDTKTLCLYPVMTLEEVSKKMTVNNSLVPLQFTGINDVEGQEIYEGYIISGYSKPHIVTFVDGAFYLTYKNSSVRLSRTCGALKVLGNIFENPELLQDVH